MLDPNDLLLFARVAETGSFTRAAERARLPKSTVSRRVSALEAQLGERLLLRSTRKLSLTDFGQALLEHARQVGAEVDAVAALAMHRQARPSGTLRVSAPGDFAYSVLAEALAAFVERHPEVTLEMDLSPRRVDLIAENFDIALRMGPLGEDSQLAARRLMTMTMGLYASPDYIARQGEPLTPEALLHMDGLLLLTRSGEPETWTLLRGKGANPAEAQERWSGRPPARAVVNSPAVLLNLACAGRGIAAFSEVLAEPQLKAGRLVRVLPGWCLPPVDAWLVFPGRRLMPAKSRAFIDLMIERIGQRCAELEARARREEGPDGLPGTQKPPQEI